MFLAAAIISQGFAGAGKRDWDAWS